jgi:uncharacterized membrane protein
MNLSRLPVHQGFRLRGQAVTRLETLVDAAFAFAATLLVVSFDAMPSSFAELHEALRRLPAFLGGFAILMLFWHSHHRFSRRFGLEDGLVITLSLALVASTLFYVYPLRMVMSAAMHFFTAGWAPSEFVAEGLGEFQAIFVIYGLGFAALAGIMAALNFHAWRHADDLRLDAAEKAMARAEIVVHLVLAGCAGLSMLIALLLPREAGWTYALPGLAYALLALVLPVYGIVSQRRVDALVLERGAE